MSKCFALIWTIIVFCPAILRAETSPQVLARGPAGDGPKQPQICISPEGVIDVVYAMGDEIHVSTSRDRGSSFSLASGMIRCPKLMAGMRRGPRVVRTKTALVVTAIGGKQSTDQGGNLLSWNSTDEGVTWSNSIAVNDVAASAREGLHGMTVGSNGDIWCVWLDLRNGKTEIFTATSSDEGQTWNKNVQAYHSPGGSVCECCHPSIIAGGKSGVSVLFRNSVGGQRDMFLLGSSDGKKFSAGRKLGKGSWKLDACPMDGGMLASDGKEQTVTVWRRDNQVFATSGNGQTEKLLGTGQQPWVAWSAAGPVMVWTQGREGPLSVQIGLVGSARQITPNAHDPVVASNAQSDFAIICWEAKQNGESAVMAEVLATPAGPSKKSK